MIAFGLYFILAALNSVSGLASTNGVDVSTLVSVETIQCLQSQGYQFITPRIYMDAGGGQCDPNGLQTMKNAQSVGMNTFGYIFPNPQTILNGGANASTQVAEALYCLAVSGQSLELVWLDIEGCFLCLCFLFHIYRDRHSYFAPGAIDYFCIFF